MLLLLAGGLMIASIAIIDFFTPSLPLGYLYLIPILFIAGFLLRCIDRRVKPL
jgi:hypothetical protein